jgi:hypothetical protein
VTSHWGFPVLVNESRAWEAAPSDKEASNSGTLTAPLGISISPCLANGVLLGRGNRAARENTGPEDSGQDCGKDLLHYSIT